MSNENEHSGAGSLLFMVGVIAGMFYLAMRFPRTFLLLLVVACFVHRPVDTYPESRIHHAVQQVEIAPVNNAPVYVPVMPVRIAAPNLPLEDGCHATASGDANSLVCYTAPKKN